MLVPWCALIGMGWVVPILIISCVHHWEVHSPESHIKDALDDDDEALLSAFTF